ncbi:MAG TPA: hypothetical protein GX398_06175, partial [Candidatus Cloacimonetes bacterium]|nr:hypothetical protein [Candidatus Cloacimonadota bacterium]
VIVTWMSAGVYLLWMKTQLKLRLGDFFALWQVIKTAAAVLGAGLAAYLILKLCPNIYVAYGAALIAFCLLYLLLGYQVKAIHPYDIELARSFVLSLFRKKKPATEGPERNG